MKFIRINQLANRESGDYIRFINYLRAKDFKYFEFDDESNYLKIHFNERSFCGYIKGFNHYDFLNFMISQSDKIFRIDLL